MTLLLDSAKRGMLLQVIVSCSRNHKKVFILSTIYSSSILNILPAKRINRVPVAQETRDGTMMAYSKMALAFEHVPTDILTFLSVAHPRGVMYVYDIMIQ